MKNYIAAKIAIISWKMREVSKAALDSCMTIVCTQAMVEMFI